MKQNSLNTYLNGAQTDLFPSKSASIKPAEHHADMYMSRSQFTVSVALTVHYSWQSASSF